MLRLLQLAIVLAASSSLRLAAAGGDYGDPDVSDAPKTAVAAQKGRDGTRTMCVAPLPAEFNWDLFEPHLRPKGKGSAPFFNNFTPVSNCHGERARGGARVDGMHGMIAIFMIMHIGGGHVRTPAWLQRPRW